MPRGESQNLLVEVAKAEATVETKAEAEAAAEAAAVAEACQRTWSIDIEVKRAQL